MTADSRQQTADSRQVIVYTEKKLNILIINNKAHFIRLITGEMCLYA